MLYLNNTPVNVTHFPDGTTQVWKIPALENECRNGEVNIRWEFSTEAECMHLAQLCQLVEEFSVKKHLYISYLPYGRQDKDVANDATFSLYTFAKLLNSLDFVEVVVMDPHSLVAGLIINNLRAIYPRQQLKEVLDLTKSDLVCYPDKGALMKYRMIYELPYVYGEKVRDQSSGNILSYKLVGDPKDKTVLIVDDICDGGMTFKLLAKDLLAAGAKEVNLFVTHGIFSKGLRTLTDSGIKRVFTKDGEACKYQDQIMYRRLS